MRVISMRKSMDSIQSQFSGPSSIGFKPNVLRLGMELPQLSINKLHKRFNSRLKKYQHHRGRKKSKGRASKLNK
jgi:hypothetical protein